MPNGRHVSVLTSPTPGEAAAVAAVPPNGRFRCTDAAGASGASSASDARRRLAASVSLAMSAAEGGGEGEAGGTGATQPLGEVSGTLQSSLSRQLGERRRSIKEGEATDQSFFSLRRAGSNPTSH